MERKRKEKAMEREKANRKETRRVAGTRKTKNP